ncbi:DUF4249 family protein [Fulvivirga lutimaris]|uniref:DUF4249 family protein n=1 Tax=Fulvivirga lutimaris TaxID=1819566 RepID=UPI0012BC78AF|nr:DUF4249 family protein [Fulvivirga lutimaris]MTI39882.1 DUF4249 family protein [Fulvivirga lutimaris]
MIVKNLHIVFLCVSALLTACLPEPLPVNNVPVLENTVVVGSQELPDEFIAISLSKSFGALDAGPDSDIEALLDELLIDSVEMFIEVAGQNYQLQNLTNGIYLGTDIPEIVGEEYTLSFINPLNKKPVVSKSNLLPFIGFDSLEISLNETAFDTLINVNLWIEDPAQKNWYMVNVQTFNEDYDIQARPYTELLDDIDFNGELYNHKFTIPFRDYEPGDTIFVSMANINEEYYEFLKLRKDQRFSLLDGLGEPINYPTNVENGLGFFHTHQPDIRFVLFGQ